MKHIKLFEAFVNEAKVDARAFENQFQSLIADIKEYYEEEISDAGMASILTNVWDEVVEQNNFHDMIGSLDLAFRKTNVSTDPDRYKTGNHAKTSAKEFGAKMYGATGFSWEGTMKCFKALFPMANIKGAQAKKIESMLNDFMK